MNGEAEFLDGYSAESFDRPSVAVDIALITVIDESLGVLLIRRRQHPHRGRWQLPGGFVHVDEPLDAAAARVLEAKAGITGAYTEQLYTFGEVGRDPRTRVISVAYYALVERAALRGQDQDTLVASIDVPWAGETGGNVVLRGAGKCLVPAFDHDQIIGMAVKRLRGKLTYSPVGYQLLPKEFTLLALQRVHEAILGAPVNKDSFRRRMLASGELEATSNRQTGVGHRPAALYRHRRA